MHKICTKYAIICNKICNHMQKYAQICILYAKIYAEICTNKDSFSKIMQKYARNMQEICTNMQFYMQQYAKICNSNMHLYAKIYANICENIRVYVFAYGAYICTPHFADDTGSVHILHVFMSIHGICRNQRGCAYIYIYRVCPYFVFFCIFRRATHEVSRAATASE